MIWKPSKPKVYPSIKNLLKGIKYNYSRYLFAMSSALKSNMSSSCQVVAVAQMRATNNKGENFAIIRELVEKAASRGAQMLFLPEACDYIAESKKEALDMAEPQNGRTLANYCQLAGSFNIWLSVGGMHIKEENSSKISNTHFLIDNLGNVASKYIKAHLFNVKIPERNIDLQESKYIEEGDTIRSPVMTPCGLVALGICYDMRFPEFSVLHRKAGAQILTFPSAFTVTTGLAHWHTLLKARAIETQCYVVAAAQTGQHNSKRSSFGHALIVDPWGTVVAEVSEGTNVAFAEIDLKYLEKVREEMPVLKHRRKDLYSLYRSPVSSEPGLMELMEFPCDFVTYPFGQVSVPGRCIFLQTTCSHAFVNKKPFTTGHVLVTPQKPIKRFIDMNQREVSDFSQTLAMTVQVLISKYSPLLVQVAIQDGKCAGQTINHVHAHILPIRKEGKVLLENHEMKNERECRDSDDMEKEAAALRQHTVNIHKNNSCLLLTNIPRPLRLKNPRTRDLFQVNELSIPTEKVFLYTGSCFAFLPGNSILHGHICVCPCEEASSFSDLTPGEVSDIFLSLQKIQKTIEDYFAVSSTTIFINNSLEEKGLRAHILPRKENDLQYNDDIYALLHNHELDAPNDSQEELLSHLKKSFLPTL